MAPRTNIVSMPSRTHSTTGMNVSTMDTTTAPPASCSVRCTAVTTSLLGTHAFGNASFRPARHVASQSTGWTRESTIAKRPARGAQSFS